MRVRDKLLGRRAGGQPPKKMTGKKIRTRGEASLVEQVSALTLRDN